MAFPVFTFNVNRAKRGDRGRHLQTGRIFTFIAKAKCGHNGAIVEWDENPFPVRSVDGEPNHVHFVGIARDAEPID